MTNKKRIKTKSENIQFLIKVNFLFLTFTKDIHVIIKKCIRQVIVFRYEIKIPTVNKHMQFLLQNYIDLHPRMRFSTTVEVFEMAHERIIPSRTVELVDMAHER